MKAPSSIPWPPPRPAVLLALVAAVAVLAFSLGFGLPADADPLARQDDATPGDSPSASSPSSGATDAPGATDTRSSPSGGAPFGPEASASASGSPGASAPGPGPGTTATPQSQPTSVATSTPGPPAPPPPTSRPTPQPTPQPTPAPPAPGWVVVVNDQFNSGGVPSHWGLYNGPYGSGPRNCAVPSHASVSGGSLQMLMRHESSGLCGAGWYTTGMMLSSSFASVDQRITLRFRIQGSGVSSHYIIPMRWPASGAWPIDGEEDYCEGDGPGGCSTFLHYGASNEQVSHRYGVDLASWHTIRVERRNHVVRVYFDNMASPAWTYVGSAQTLPDTLKRVVLQQECDPSGCPSGTSGSELIQIDWIIVENPT